MRYSEAVERGYDGPPPRRHRRRRTCGEVAYTYAWTEPCGLQECSICGWDDEEPEEDLCTRVTHYHLAAKDYPEDGIEAGDLYARTTGFYYAKEGPRLGYMRPERHLVSRPPGTPEHNEARWARGMERRATQSRSR